MATSSYNFVPVIIGAPVLTTIFQQVSTDSGNNNTYTNGVNINLLIGEKVFLDGAIAFKNLDETASYARIVDVDDGTVYQTFTLPAKAYTATIDYEDLFDVKCLIAGHIETRINFKLL